MEVAELTASLNIAGLQGFLSGLASADRAVNELRGDLEKLAAAAELAKAAMADLGAPASAVGKQAALNAELKKTRDLLAEIKALSGFEGGGGVSAGARVAAPVNLGGLASNRYGLLGALLGQDAAMQYNNYLLQQARRDASSAGLEGALFGAQQATVTQREVVTAVKTATENAPVATAVAAGVAAGGGGGGVIPVSAPGGGGGGKLDAFSAGVAGGFFGGGSGGIGIPWWLGGRFLGGRIPGLAAFGSLGGLAGFGAEHLLTSGVGIGGSLLGAAGGGALAAGGVLGTAAVGIGTDLAGIGQAGGDIKTVTGDLSGLQKAIQEYGRNSQQAATAQAQLNYDLGNFSAVARPAVLQASQTAQGFRALFDQLTGPAEKVGAQILNQAMLVGESFLPTIGKYAAQNLNIIQRDLQPLFTWLQNAGPSGGLGVFTQLEKIFQANLPAGVNALTQGLELFVRTIGVAAQDTRGFVGSLSGFLTRLNTTGFSAWSAEVTKLIGLFKTWVDTFYSFGQVIFALFKPAVGFGGQFAEMLTGIFKQIDGWLNQSTTKQLLGGLFQAHFTEVIKGLGGLFEALLPLLEKTADAFIIISTDMTDLVNTALKPLVDAVKFLTASNFNDWLLGIGGATLLVRNAIGGVYGLITGAGASVARLFGFGIPVAEQEAAAATERMSLAMSASLAPVVTELQGIRAMLAVEIPDAAAAGAAEIEAALGAEAAAAKATLVQFEALATVLGTTIPEAAVAGATEIEAVTPGIVTAGEAATAAWNPLFVLFGGIVALGYELGNLFDNTPNASTATVAQAKALLASKPGSFLYGAEQNLMKTATGREQLRNLYATAGIPIPPDLAYLGPSVGNTQFNPNEAPMGLTPAQAAAWYASNRVLTGSVSNMITQASGMYGLNATALLQIANVEGLSGQPGDYGTFATGKFVPLAPGTPGGEYTSFGPFQLHASGELPNWVWQRGPAFAQAWANSPAGIQYALQKIKQSGAAGLTGTAALKAISAFENPSAPLKDYYAALGQTPPTGAGPNTALAGGYQPPLAVQTAISNAVTAASLAQPGSRAAALAVKQEIAVYKQAIQTVDAQLSSLSAPNRITAQGYVQQYASALQGLLGTGAAATTGLGFFSADRQARINAGGTAATGVTGATPVTQANLRAELGLANQLGSAYASINQRIKDGVYAGIQRTNAVKERLQLTNQIAAADLVINGLESQIPPGLAARIQLAQQNASGITGSTAPTTTGIRAVRGEVVQLGAAITEQEKAMRAAGGPTTAAGQAINARITALKTQREAAQALLSGQSTALSVEGTLGIGGTGASTGVAAARAASASLRDSLNTMLGRFGLAGTGSAALGPYVTELHKLGDISNRQYTSLEKILTSIKEMSKDTKTLADATTIQQNISERLKEIQQEQAAGTGFANLYRAPRGFSLRGLSAGQAEAVASALEHHGTAPVGGAAGGVGILPNGKVATAANAREYFASSITGLPSHVSGRYSSGGPAQVTININGYNKDPIAFATEVAARVGEIQSRTAYRNNTQVRGAFAGLAKPFQW